MRITIVTGFFLPIPPVQGGATEKIWFRLAREFADAGHEVTFVSRQWPGFPDRESAGRLTHLRLRGANHTRRLWLNLLLDLRWGWRVMRRLPPADVTVCNTVALPVFLHRLRPSAGRVVAVIARMPKGQLRFYGGVDRLLALSEAVAASIARQAPRLAVRTRLFPFPIDWAMHQRAASQAEDGKPLVIGYVGRIHPEKGLHVLLAAAALLAERPGLPPWRLRLIGPCDVPRGGGGESYQIALDEKFRPALGSRLEWIPPVFEPAALAEHYGRIDVFCYPSLAERGETFGHAVAEAMAARAAPVVSALACFRDLVTDGRNGLVFDHTAAGAAALLADSLARLLGDPGLRRELAARAQADVRRFDYAESAHRLLADFAQLTAPTR